MGLRLKAGFGAIAALGVAPLGFVELAARRPAGQGDALRAEVEIPKGVGLVRIGRLLAEEGYLGGTAIWSLYLKIHRDHAPKAGKHLLSRSMSIVEILRVLDDNPLPDDAPLTVVEGSRLRDTDAQLAGAGLIDAGAYLAAAHDPARFKIPFPFSAKDLEGYLYPETYMVPRGRLDVDKLIQRQVDAFNERFFKVYESELERSGRKLHAIVTMASMLEREEPKPDNRTKVAGLLFKRLDANKPLGVDATSRYLLADWSERTAFLARLRDPDDAYNTRLKAGLPIGPIGAPSVPSLAAALRPTESEFWYYLHDGEQNIHYARTPEEHEANRKRYNVY